MAVQHLSHGGRSTRRWRFENGPLDLGDVVDAVMAYAADSREAALVIEDLLTTGRIRLTRRGGSIWGTGIAGRGVTTT
jgi:hypothetical protein